MQLDIDWSIIPTHTIDVSTINAPYDISLIMKSLKIDRYCYQIMYKGIVIKYGMSADNSRNYGDRLYRQIGHSKSWGKQRLNGSSGADWRVVEEDFLDVYGFPIDVGNMTVKLWDLTNYPYVTINPWDEVNAIEAQLIDAYVQAVGEKPIGNINDEANVIRRAGIRIDTMDRLFDVY